uniref:Fatty acid desaturase domain-containing protein n=1 Tax=Globisporangium ultimum (strain ATCC 200006 / CBS 805.95 / DAOM BR144) TaxID=431595 RepID=K3WWS5_GLOUD
MATWTELLQQTNWFMCFKLLVVHVASLMGLYGVVTDMKWSTVPLFLVVYYLSGLGITMGAHRLWSHRSYKAHGSVRFFLMLCNSLANQGTIFHWTRDHRVHHKYSDTSADPHDSGRGFFFAHMGWLMLKKDPRVIQAGNNLNYDDLWADWVVVLQDKCNPWGEIFMCFVVPTYAGMYLCDETYYNSLFILGFLRYTIVLHATWLVNSAAHFYGYTPYDDSIVPRENWIVSLGAIGEGWHNWHHKFPYDYATSEFGVTQQFNPTKLTIDLFAALGLIWDRKRATGVWEKMKAAKEQGHDAGKSVQDPLGDDPTLAFSQLKAKSV